MRFWFHFRSFRRLLEWLRRWNWHWTCFQDRAQADLDLEVAIHVLRLFEGWMAGGRTTGKDLLAFYSGPFQEWRDDIDADDRTDKLTWNCTEAILLVSGIRH